MDVTICARAVIFSNYKSWVATHNTGVHHLCYCWVHAESTHPLEQLSKDMCILVASLPLSSGAQHADATHNLKLKLAFLQEMFGVSDDLVINAHDTWCRLLPTGDRRSSAKGERLQFATPRTQAASVTLIMSPNPDFGLKAQVHTFLFLQLKETTLVSRRFLNLPRRLHILDGPSVGVQPHSLTFVPHLPSCDDRLCHISHVEPSLDFLSASPC